jgi:DnaK suppressor protein
MNPQARRRLAERLDELRAELVREGDVVIESEADGEVVHKPDDDAAPLEEMNKVIASNRNRERAARMLEIDEALARLRDAPDDFGLCEGCEEPIAQRRLELMPWTRLCIECQSAREADRVGGRRHITDYR